MDDGYCRYCGKDFKGEGSFCSNICEEQYKDTLKTPCEVCGKKLDWFEEIRHHISYSPPEKVIIVCAGCHNKIHKTNKFPQFKPNKDEIDKFYRR